MAWLQRERTHTDTDLAQAIQDSSVWREKDDPLRSVPNVRPVLTTTLLANVPELGTLTNKQIAACVGVAPLNRDSGTLHGKRMVRGGVRRFGRPSTWLPSWRHATTRQSRRSISACVGWEKPRRWPSSPVCGNC
jgi:transposase